LTPKGLGVAGDVLTEPLEDAIKVFAAERLRRFVQAQSGRVASGGELVGGQVGAKSPDALVLHDLRVYFASG